MTMQELNNLWTIFGNVAINNNDEIDEQFLQFPKGTDKTVIWLWFEKQNKDFSIAKKLYGKH